jgi:geranylgeranyl reductase
MCDDKDVQRLTFDSYLYKRVVAMNPWQQFKLTVLTLASVLRGQALAPLGYKPVDSAVRSEEETQAILAETAAAAIKVGARLEKEQAAAAAPADAGLIDQAVATGEEREPAIAAR